MLMRNIKKKQLDLPFYFKCRKKYVVNSQILKSIKDNMILRIPTLIINILFIVQYKLNRSNACWECILKKETCKPILYFGFVYECDRSIKDNIIVTTQYPYTLWLSNFTCILHYKLHYNMYHRKSRIPVLTLW